MRRSFEPKVGRVFLRIFGSSRAARMSSASRSSASRRFCSWLRSLRALMRMLPSSISLCPARRRSRFLAAVGKLVFRGSRKRSCTALATLLTFWPPGPDERMNFHSNSSSGIETSGVTMSIGAYANYSHRLLFQIRNVVMHPDLVLRDGYCDSMLLEQPPDGAVDVGTNIVHAVLWVGYPEAQFEFDAAVAEMHETRHRQRVAQDPSLALARSQQDLQSEFRIVAVAHADGQLQADAGISVAPVDDRIRDQLLIGNQHLDAVAIAHHDIAAAQFLDPAEILRAGAGLTRRAEDVPRLGRSIHQENETADEIGGDRLQAEAQAEADRAGQHGERGKIDAGGVEAHQNAEGDQKGVRELCDADAGGGRKVAELLQPPFDPAADPGGDQHEQREGEQQFENRPARDAALAGDDADAVEGGDDGIEPAEILRGYREPDQQRDPVLPVLHPGFVAETCRKEEDPDADRHVGADQAYCGVDLGDVEVRREQHTAR